MSNPRQSSNRSESDLRLEAAVAAKNNREEGLLKVTAADGGFFGSGDMGTIRIPMLYMDPMFDQILVLFPQDNIRELNRRLRHYYRYNPYIRSIIDFHTETPISDFELRCPESTEAEEYYRDYKDRVDLFEVCTQALRDYWLLGESFHFGNWDDTELEFDSFVHYPPEEVQISSAYISPQKVYALRPNKDIAKLMGSTNPSDIIIADYIRTAMPQQAHAIANNQPHILKSSQLIVMQRTMAGYIERGVSPLLSVVKDLMYEDFLNLYRTTFIQRHSYPLKLFKLGSESKGFIPSRKMFSEFRAQLVQASNDPDYNLVTHPFINIEYVTGHDKILHLIPYYELVKSRIFAGLFVSDAIVSGEKTPYASGITFMKGLMNRYLTVRNQLEREIKRKVFYHLARARKFYKPSPADIAHNVRTRRTDSNLIIPEFFWKKANLLSNQAIMTMAMTLRDKKEIPMRFVAEMMGWDLDDIIYQLKREEGTRLDPKWRKAVDDAIAKDPELAKKLILGDDIDEALKAKFKEQKDEAPPEPPKTTPAKGRGKPEEFKLPEAIGPSTMVTPPEGGKKPAESEDKAPASPPEGGLPERKPRPGEKEPGGEG
jgi:hypothetical protein